MRYLARVIMVIMTLAIVAMAPTTSKAADDFYTENEILNAARGFFGETSGGLATVVEKNLRRVGQAKRLYPR